MRLLVFLICLSTILVGCSRGLPEHVDGGPSANSEQDSSAADLVGQSGNPALFYSVSHYDKTADPVVDLDRTVKRATEEEKRILLQVGGDWCGWCARVSDYMQTNHQVHEMLTEKFVVMKVTYPGEHAESFLQQYPKCDAYPHFFVLEKDGTFLHSQGTGELEQDQSYDEGRFVEFLTEWVR